MSRINEGDILVGGWGYDQTNIDYLVVVKRTPTTVLVRDCATTVKATQGTLDSVVPDVDRVPLHGGWCRGGERRFKVQKAHDGSEYISAARWAGAPIFHKWSGQANWQTNPQFGH